jgi:PAS domain S-box-containing protein
MIDLRRTKGLEAVAQVAQSGRGDRIMDEIRATVDTLQNEELHLLAQRDAAAQWRFRDAKTVLLFGTILGLLITAAAGWSVQRDGIKRGVAEEALRDREEKYRTLVHAVQDYAIFMLDPLGQVVTWNAGAERINGYSAAEIIGSNYSSFFPPDDVKRGRAQEVLRNAAASGRHEEQALRVRKDGSEFLASVTVTALRDLGRKLQGFSEISRDLSETKESEAKYRGLLEAALMPWWW